MNLNNYFSRLKNIYEKLDELLKPASGNCGHCCICCLNIKETVFTLLEAKYIHENLFKEETDFEDFFYTVRNNIICPFCDMEKGRCNIYNYRPSICRRWGPFVDETGSYMFKCCVYSKEAHIFPVEKTKDLPFVRELVSLNELYIKNQERKIEKNPKKNPDRTKKDIKDLKRALKISFHRGPILTLIGRGYAKLGDFTKADHYYNKAISVTTDYDFAWYLKGLNSYAMKDYHNAEIDLTEARSINPDNINIRSFLIMFYIETNKYSSAGKEIEFSQERYPYILVRYPFLKEFLQRSKTLV